MAGIKNIILLAVALMVVAVIFPIALGLIGNAGRVIINATSGARLEDVVDPSIITLLTVLLPIIAIIAVVLYFLPKSKSA